MAVGNYRMPDSLCTERRAGEKAQRHYAGCSQKLLQ
jgi:hypothetical protein